MRLPALAAIAATLLCTAAAEARLFYQSFGATVPTADGGCVWNINQDYFVPRHCHSCRYGLFSDCKTSHTTSAACRHCHPIYPGYCSPYGACRYRWRDHVYKEHCGCTPLACYHGPWRNEYCGKCRPPLMRHCDRVPNCGTHCETNGGSSDVGSFGIDYVAHGPVGGPIPNVEGYELEVLGTVAAESESMLVGATLDEAARAASGIQGEIPQGRLLPSFGVPQSNPGRLIPPAYSNEK